MSRATRLLQLMQYLRSHPAPILARDVAAALEVSQRSIYRDIDSLRAAGAVIDGAAGYGYVLVEDPALPPMSFSREEMEALVLGLGEVREVGDPALASAAKSAEAKLKAVLPPAMRQQMNHSVLHAKRFHKRPEITINAKLLRDATWAEVAVDLDYADQEARETKRRVLPLSIVFMDQTSVLLAFCQLRQDFRVFRLDRMKRLSKTSESFRPKRVSLLRACLESIK